MGEENQNVFDITLKPKVDDSDLVKFEQDLRKKDKQYINVGVKVGSDTQEEQKKLRQLIKQMKMFNSFDSTLSKEIKIKIDTKGFDSQVAKLISDLKSIKKDFVISPKIADISQLAEAKHDTKPSQSSSKKRESIDTYIKQAKKAGEKYVGGSSKNNLELIKDDIRKSSSKITNSNYNDKLSLLMPRLSALYGYIDNIADIIKRVSEEFGADSEEYKQLIDNLPDTDFLKIKEFPSNIREELDKLITEVQESITKDINSSIKKLSDDPTKDVDGKIKGQFVELKNRWETRDKGYFTYKEIGDMFKADLEDGMFDTREIPVQKKTIQATTQKGVPSNQSVTGNVILNSQNLEKSLSQLRGVIVILNNSLDGNLGGVKDSVNNLITNLNKFSATINDRTNNFIHSSNLPEEWKEKPDSNSTSSRFSLLLSTLDKNYKKVLKSNDELAKSQGKNLLDFSEEQLNKVVKEYDSLVDKTVHIDFDIENIEEIIEIGKIIETISKYTKEKENTESANTGSKNGESPRKNAEPLPEDDTLGRRAAAMTPAKDKSETNKEPSKQTVKDFKKAEHIYNNLVDKVVKISFDIPEEDMNSLVSANNLYREISDKNLASSVVKIDDASINALAAKIEELTNTIVTNQNSGESSGNPDIQQSPINTVLSEITGVLNSMLSVQSEIKGILNNTNKFTIGDLSEQSANTLLSSINDFSNKIQNIQFSDEGINKLITAINNNNKGNGGKQGKKTEKEPIKINPNLNRTDLLTQTEEKQATVEKYLNAFNLAKDDGGVNVLDENALKTDIDKLGQLNKRINDIKKSLSSEKLMSGSFEDMNQKLQDLDSELTTVSKDLDDIVKSGKNEKLSKYAVTFADMVSKGEELDTVINKLKSYKSELGKLGIVKPELEDLLKDAGDERKSIKGIIRSNKKNPVTGKSRIGRKQTTAESRINETEKIIADALKMSEDIQPYIDSVSDLALFKDSKGDLFGEVSNLEKVINKVKKNKLDLKTFMFGDVKSAEEVEKLIKDFKTQINGIDFDKFNASDKQAIEDNFVNPLKELIRVAEQANKAIDNLAADNAYNKSQVSNINAGIDLSKRIETAKLQLEKWKESNSKTMNDPVLANQFNQFVERLNNGSIKNAQDFKLFNEELAAFKYNVTAAGKAGRSAGDVISGMYKKFGGWTMVTKSIGEVIRLLKDMVTQTKAVDTAMTNLKKVTPASNNKLKEYLDVASSQSISVGTTLNDYIDATSQFSRLGYNLDKAQEYGELATKYKTVAEDLDINTASQSIISTLNAYEKYGVKAQEIVDTFNYVGNNFSISSAGIGESLQRSAASLAASNTSLSQSIALITAGNTIVQDPDKMGTMLKTVSARIRGAKSELDEDSDGIVMTTAKLQQSIKNLSGVDIMVSPTQFKDVYTIFDELSAVWDKLSDIDQASIAEMLGGKMGHNVVQAIISNFKTARDVYSELEGGLAEGSADKELEESLDSIDGKTNQLISTWQTLSTDVVDSDTVKGVIDFLRKLLELLDKVVRLSEKLNINGGTIATFAATMLGQKFVRDKTGSGRAKMFALMNMPE